MIEIAFPDEEACLADGVCRVVHVSALGVAAVAGFAAVGALARRSGATPFMVLTGVLAALLARLGGGAGEARRVLFAWLTVNLFLGSQLSWVLRPFIGSPGLPVAVCHVRWSEAA